MGHTTFDAVPFTPYDAVPRTTDAVAERALTRPPAPDRDELSDDDLERVVGGLARVFSDPLSDSASPTGFSG